MSCRENFAIFLYLPNNVWIGKFRKSRKWIHIDIIEYTFMSKHEKNIIQKQKKLIRKIRTSQGIELNL